MTEFAGFLAWQPCPSRDRLSAADHLRAEAGAIDASADNAMASAVPAKFNVELHPGVVPGLMALHEEGG